MKLGLIGIGKMGYNLAKNILANGHELVVYDVMPANTNGLKEKGANIAADLVDMVNQLESPRVLYMMVPVGKPVEETLNLLKTVCQPGDIIVDGGNSYYGDTVRRSEELQEFGLSYLDCGTSGGKEGALEGVCVMIGGDESAYQRNSRDRLPCRGKEYLGLWSVIQFVLSDDSVIFSRVANISGSCLFFP